MAFLFFMLFTQWEVLSSYVIFLLFMVVHVLLGLRRLRRHGYWFWPRAPTPPPGQAVKEREAQPPPNSGGSLTMELDEGWMGLVLHAHGSVLEFFLGTALRGTCYPLAVWSLSFGIP